MKKSQWRCEQCGKPIADGKGTVGVADAEDGGYPRHGTPEMKWPDSGSGPLGLRTMADLLEALPPPAIRFSAYHRACDPRPDSNEYWMTVERVATLEEWVEFVIHLCGKSWMAKQDVERALEYWFKNRGVAPVLGHKPSTVSTAG